MTLPDSLTIVASLHGTEQAVDVALGKRGPGFLTDLDRLVAFTAADAVRISFALEFAIRPEIGGGVDELAWIEGDPGQAIVKAPGRHRLGDHHVGAGVAGELYGGFPAVAGHHQDRD